MYINGFDTCIMQYGEGEKKHDKTDNSDDFELFRNDKG